MSRVAGDGRGPPLESVVAGAGPGDPCREDPGGGKGLLEGAGPPPAGFGAPGRGPGAPLRDSWGAGGVQGGC